MMRLVLGGPVRDEGKGESAMAMRRIRPVVAPLAGAALLGGCATYRPAPQGIAYVPAPCTAPGALRAVPAAPPPDPQPAAPATAPPGTDGMAGDRCLVAVAAGRGGYYGARYPYSYGYPGAYRAPFYGTFGFGIGIGGHARGGHFGGGHLAAGHGGGHH